MRREAALEVLREHKLGFEELYSITRIGLFGSVARDEATDESDVDVVVEMAPDLLWKGKPQRNRRRFLGQRSILRYWRRMNHYLKSRIDREAHYVL